MLALTSLGAVLESSKKFRAPPRLQKRRPSSKNGVTANIESILFARNLTPVMCLTVITSHDVITVKKY